MPKTSQFPPIFLSFSLKTGLQCCLDFISSDPCEGIGINVPRQRKTSKRGTWVFLSSYFNILSWLWAVTTPAIHTNSKQILHLPKGFSCCSLNPGILRFFSKVILGLIFREDAVICANSASWQEREPSLAGLSLGGFWQFTQTDLKNWVTLLCQNSFHSHLLIYVRFLVPTSLKTKTTIQLMLNAVFF